MKTITIKLAGEITGLILLVILSGCTTTGERLATAPVYDIDAVDAVVADNYRNGSLYNSQSSISLYNDNKAARVGDIITILLVEQTNAAKSASTTTKKDNNLDVANPTILGSAFSGSVPGVLPFGGVNRGLDASLSSTKTFNGEGDSAQSNKMTGTVSAIVVKRLQNGNLVVSGKKRITINNGDEYLHITGVVRPKDISSTNTIQSTKIANAEIAYSGTGVVSSVNETGWLTRFFNSKWWPF